MNIQRFVKSAGLFTSLLLTAGIAVTGCIHVRVTRTASLPKSGRELLAQMHQRYDKRWFTTLTFVQQTTITRADASVVQQTWYESLRAPDRLRIDVAPLTNNNGSLATADSTYIVRAGALTNTRAEGNPFLPFVVGVYTQPVERTIEQIAPLHFDLSVVHQTQFLGRDVFVVGSARDDDFKSPQFWVDAERLVVVRMLLPGAGTATTPAQPQEIVLDKYVETGGGWLATKVTFAVGGKIRQLEEYSDWQTNMKLPDELFDPKAWNKAVHWAAGR